MSQCVSTRAGSPLQGKETVRLFDAAPYDTEFDAVIVSVLPGETEKTVRLVLDSTLFFPEEGGQTPDTGHLGGLPVTDVQIGPGGVIMHSLSLSDGESAPLCPGRTVHGVIDWAHRYSNMQNHSGEHVLSGLLHSLYGYENVGFRLSDNTVTLDTSGILTRDQLTDLERRANEVVWRNVPITCEYPPPDILRTLEYRSKKEIEGAVRIVTIEGVDVCACCAPHVRRTGEIGLIKILSAVRSRGGSTRITLVCGQRALLQVQKAQTQLEEASHLMNQPQDAVASGVKRLQDEILSLKEALRAKEMQLAEVQLRQIQETAPPDPEIRERSIFLFSGDLSVLAQRALMNRLCEMGWKYAGVLCGSDEAGWKYLIGSRSGDARVPNQLLKERFGARGGGKPDMVQGTVLSPQEQIHAALQSL